MIEFKFPDVGEGIQEGEIVKWKINVGDTVTVDQVLVEVETDKAVVEIPSPQAGVILSLHAKEGETIAVGSVLVTIGKKGEIPQKTAIVQATTAKPQGASVVGILEEAPNEPENITPFKPISPTNSDTKPSKSVLAMPKIKKIAKEKGIDITSIIGSGPNGHIVEADLTPTSDNTPAIKHVRKYDFFGFVERIPFKGMRKVIATRLANSFHTTVPVTHFDEANITLLHGLRDTFKPKYEEKGIKLTYLPFIIRAVIEGLKQFPRLNSSLEEDEIILKKYYNIGIAIDTGDGLVVPVIKEAQDKGVGQLSKEISAYAAKTKDKKLDPMEMKGGSFTITNVGSIGGIFATPIINPPEAAILALGRGYEKPTSHKGHIRIKFVLPMSLTFDHRILDGAEAARFMNVVKDYLANPQSLFVQMDLEELT